MDYRPAYMRIVDDIQHDIEHGVYMEGDCIPTQLQLAEKYNVSRITVRDAINELIHMGLLYTKQGKGTFVAPKSHLSYPAMRSRSFSGEIKHAGMSVTTQVLALEHCIADIRLCNAFGMKEGFPLVRLSRLRSIGGFRTLVSTSYLDAERFREIDFLKEDFGTHSLYETLIQRTGLVISGTEEEFRAVKCPAYIAKLLELSEDEPVIYVKRSTFDAQGRCFEWSEQYERTDRFGIKVRSENR